MESKPAPAREPEANVSESDDLYVGGLRGRHPVGSVESLTGDNTEDPLDAGYSPPDYEPHATRYGTTAEEQWEGESLDQLLTEEEPDVSADGYPVADDYDIEFTAPDPAPGGSSLRMRARIRDTEADEVADDVGRSGGAASAEGAAVHIISEEGDMRLTKFAHSCVRLDDDSRARRRPGSFLDAAQVTDAFQGAHAVLVTHEHGDHINVEAVRAVATADPELHLWAPASVATQFAGLGDRVSHGPCEQIVQGGRIRYPDLRGPDALIHPTVPIVATLRFSSTNRSTTPAIH